MKKTSNAQKGDTVADMLKTVNALLDRCDETIGLEIVAAHLQYAADLLEQISHQET